MDAVSNSTFMRYKLKNNSKPPVISEHNQKKLDELMTANKKHNAELKDACDGFEDLFMHKMLTEMRKATEKSGLVDGGQGEEIFQGMLDENYAKQLTQSRAVGLSKIIFDQTKRPEEPQVLSRYADMELSKAHKG